MTKPAARHASPGAPQFPVATSHREPAIIVCTGLALALLALVSRIMSVW